MSAPAPDAPATRRSGAIIRVAIIVAALGAGLALFTDVRAVGDALAAFDWRLTPVMLLLVLWNYAFRFARWDRYLLAIEVPRIDRVTSALIFVSAFAMALTPAKVGEVVKALHVRRATGVPVARTGAVIAAERITDGLAMVVLAVIGLVQFSYGRPFVGLFAAGSILLVVLLRKPRLIDLFLDRIAAHDRFENAVRHARGFLDASTALYTGRRLGMGIGYGVLGWAGECAACYVVLRGLGVPGGLDLLLIATFTLAVASLAGAASMIPGGLGVADASVAAILLLLVDAPAMDRTVAAAATLLVRFATLWFAVILGIVASIVVERRLARMTFPATAPDPGADVRAR